MGISAIKANTFPSPSSKSLSQSTRSPRSAIGWGALRKVMPRLESSACAAWMSCDREVEDRRGVIELSRLRRRQHEPHAVALEERERGRRLEQETEPEPVAVGGDRPVEIEHAYRDLTDGAQQGTRHGLRSRIGWSVGMAASHQRPAGSGAFDEVPVVDHDGARHDEIPNAHAGLRGCAEGRVILNRSRRRKRRYPPGRPLEAGPCVSRRASPSRVAAPASGTSSGWRPSA